MFLLLPTVYSVLILILGPAENSKVLLERYLPKHCCTNIGFSPTNRKNIKPESSFQRMSQKHILFKYRMENIDGTIHHSSFQAARHYCPFKIPKKLKRIGNHKEFFFLAAV